MERQPPRLHMFSGHASRALENDRRRGCRLRPCERLAGVQARVPFIGARETDPARSAVILEALRAQAWHRPHQSGESCAISAHHAAASSLLVLKRSPGTLPGTVVAPTASLFRRHRCRGFLQCLR